MMKSKTQKPDFMDMDKDGNRTEPMKKAVAKAKAKPDMKAAVKGRPVNKTVKMPKRKTK